MQYSPKLKNAAEEIKEILAKHDIAGMIVLHTPGHSEFVLDITPSYSCAWIQGGSLRFIAKKAEYNSIEEWRQKVADTANMISLLSDTSAQLVMNMIKASEMIDEITGAEHDKGGFTSNDTQNN